MLNGLVAACVLSAMGMSSPAKQSDRTIVRLVGQKSTIMIAASAADVDGIGRLYSEQVYWRFHHILGHNLLFGLLIALIFTAFSNHRLKALLIYLFLVHLHLLMDYFGSGPGWGISYLWPFDRHSFVNPHAWEFFSWQNITTAAVFLT